MGRPRHHGASGIAAAGQDCPGLLKVKRFITRKRRRGFEKDEEENC
jgi:hypothetical protein